MIDITFLDIIIGLVWTWGIGLLPAYLIRYVFLKRPLRKRLAIPIASLWFFFQYIASLGIKAIVDPTATDMRTSPALILVAYISYLILRKKNKEVLAGAGNISTMNNQQQTRKGNQKKGTKKKWVWTGVGIITLLGIIGSLFSSGISDKNTDFVATDKNPDHSKQVGNLYRNTKYNFRIKFPEGWDIKPGDGQNILQKAVKDNHVISVGVREIPTEFGDETATIKEVMSLSEFKGMVLSDDGVREKFPEARLLDYGESKLDNVPAYWVRYHTGPYTATNIAVEGIHIQYQLLKNNIFYFITAGSSSDDFPSSEHEFMKSIATFVFENN